MQFRMNLDLMHDGFGLGTARSEREWLLRSTLERVEQQYLSQEKVPAEIKTGDEFMVWLNIWAPR